MKKLLGPVAATLGALHVANADAAELKVLTAGAFRPVVMAVIPEFTRVSGHKVAVENATVGVLRERIESGETFDVVIVTPAVIEELVRKGKVASGTNKTLARVGVGVMVRAGAPKPDISTVEAFKQALLSAHSVAYIDPASGGSSGIYVDRLLQRLGVAEQVRAKARLKQGGYVADLIKSGEAELGIHQISEIIPVKEVELVGPLPAEIQNYTTYAAGISSGSKEPEAARALIEALAGPAAAGVLKEKGMERPNS